MECNVPTDIVFSFSGLRQRGGKTGPHRDGWGLAFYEGYAARVFLEPAPAAESPLARFLADNPIKTLLAIGHVRKRTRGEVSVANTHPFVRELWGRHWVFAHNGTIKATRGLSMGRFRPIGSTDSERAYCHLMEALASSFPFASVSLSRPTSDGRYDRYVTSKKTVSTPTAKAITYKRDIERRSSQAAAGITASNAARPKSAEIKIGRRVRVSIHAPANRPNRKSGSRRR